MALRMALLQPNRSLGADATQRTLSVQFDCAASNVPNVEMYAPLDPYWVTAVPLR